MSACRCCAGPKPRVLLMGTPAFVTAVRMVEAAKARYFAGLMAALRLSLFDTRLPAFRALAARAAPRLPAKWAGLIGAVGL